MTHMTMTQFNEAVRAVFQEIYPEAEVEIKEVSKNNGVKLTGLLVRKPGESVAPNIYLEYYYDRYKEGQSLAELTPAIQEEYEQAVSSIPTIVPETKELFRKDNIIPVLRSMRKNQGLRQFCGDWGIQLRAVVSSEGGNLASAVVDEAALNRIGETFDSIYETALDNYRKLFPTNGQRMADIIGAVYGPEAAEMPGADWLVYTNQQGINGATQMLLPEVRQEIVEKYGPCFIIPSSIHECIALPEGIADADALHGICQEVNEGVLEAQDYLSDTILYLDETGIQPAELQNAA